MIFVKFKTIRDKDQGFMVGILSVVGYQFRFTSKKLWQKLTSPPK
jgi:hypothetical protein